MSYTVYRQSDLRTVMQTQGDDIDNDYFHLFTWRSIVCVDTIRMIIYDIEVSVIRGLLNHVMNMKVETPATLPLSSAFTSTPIGGYRDGNVSSIIITSSVVVGVDIVQINQASGVVFLLSSTP